MKPALKWTNYVCRDGVASVASTVPQHIFHTPKQEPHSSINQKNGRESHLCRPELMGNVLFYCCCYSGMSR